MNSEVEKEKKSKGWLHRERKREDSPPSSAADLSARKKVSDCLFAGFMWWLTFEWWNLKESCVCFDYTYKISTHLCCCGCDSMWEFLSDFVFSCSTLLLFLFNICWWNNECVLWAISLFWPDNEDCLYSWFSLGHFWCLSKDHSRVGVGFCLGYHKDHIWLANTLIPYVICQRIL